MCTQFLLKILLTNQVKNFLREHQGDKDSHKLNAKISAHALKSTEALLNSSKLLTFVTSARVGYVSWWGTTERFIRNCQEQIILYETLVEIPDHLSGVQKRTLLENAIDPIQSLKDVKNQSGQFKTHTGTTLTYDKYSEILL